MNVLTGVPEQERRAMMDRDGNETPKYSIEERYFGEHDPEAWYDS